MTYDTPGYHHSSDTARHAAETTNAAQGRSAALEYIQAQGARGATIDEVAQRFNKPPNAVSGRFIELEKADRISKTPMRRKTRSGKPAVVYIAGSWRDSVPPVPIYPPPPDSQLATYKRQQAVHGHGHVIPRNDGRKEGCGGVSLCRICRQAKAYFTLMEEKEHENGNPQRN